MEAVDVKIKQISDYTYTLHTQWRASLKRCTFFLLFFSLFSLFQQVKKLNPTSYYDLEFVQSLQHKPNLVNHLFNLAVGLCLLAFFNNKVGFLSQLWFNMSWVLSIIQV